MSASSLIDPKKHRQRLVTGSLIGLIVVSFALAGGWYWTALVILACFLAYKELMAMMALRQIHPSRSVILIFGGLILLLAASDNSRFLLPTLTVGIIASFFRLLFRHAQATISDIGGTFLVLFYVAFLPAHFILLRNIDIPPDPDPLISPGFGYLLYTLLVIAASDIGAYYIGKLFGKRLLHPTISPKKTREGAVGGLISGVVVGQLLCLFMPLSHLHSVYLSILLVLFGQMGDLVESLFKRDAGVKDSGTLLEGHGGLLDRVDSYIFSGVVSFYYVYWVIRHNGLMQDFILWWNQQALPF